MHSLALLVALRRTATSKPDNLRRVQIASGYRSLSRGLPIVLLALTSSLVAASLAAEAQVAAGDLKPLSRDELKTAVAKGERIIGRTVQGEDITAVLSPLVTPEEKCGAPAALHIEKSAIRGEITIESKAPRAPPERPDTSDDDDTEPTPDQKNRQPSHWLSIPLVIKDSALSDRLRISLVGLTCKADFSNSVFEDAIDIRATTFMADLIAEGGIFKAGIASQGSEFKSAVIFRRAKFMGNVEFIPIAARRTIFHGNVDFHEAIFTRLASFVGSSFLSHMDFRYVQFANGASFSNAQLGTGPSRFFSGSFYMAEFGGLGGFRNARLGRPKFLRTIFRNGADFHAAKGDRLQLLGVTITGPLSFDDARIKDLEFDGFGGSMVVDGEAVFRRAQFDKLTFNRMAFKRTVDFEGASVRSKVRFRAVSFDGDLRFEDGLLPGTTQNGGDDSEDTGKPEITTPEITIRDITLNKGLYIDSGQFLSHEPWWAFWREDGSRFYSNEEGSSARDDRRIWRELRRAFDIAKNVELKNYADYMLRLSNEASQDVPTRVSSIASRWFWGYGLRLARVLFWLAVMLLAFAGIYWTQLSQVAAGRDPVSRNLIRARHALVFSTRTAWELKYGYENSTTTTFRAITIAESVLAKLVLACFAYSLTQASPLLSELMKKLLP